MADRDNRAVKEQRVHYKLDQNTPVNAYEMNTYNVPFAGNNSTCRETYIKGERTLEYTIHGDMTFEQLIVKPVFRDELIEYIYSLSRQLVSIVQNGLSLNKVVLDLRFLYARLCDFTVQVIYLPLDKAFPENNVGQFMKDTLSRLVYAHTSAVECANQILDYFDDNPDFDVFDFNRFIGELRSKSQLLIIEDQTPAALADETAEYAKKESERMLAEEAARNADKARIIAENDARRQSEEARRQAQVAKAAEEARMAAEAAKIEAEVARQRAAAEVAAQSQTAILYARQIMEQQDGIDRRQKEIERQQAEAAAKAAEEARIKAEIEASKYSDEIRRARDAEMRAEEARMRAEFEARRNSEEAKRRAEEAKRRAEEVKRLNENRDMAYYEEIRRTMAGNTTGRVTFRPGSGSYMGDVQDSSDAATTVLSTKPISGYGVPKLIRKVTGEEIPITKQVFCIGKADQGVDYKILGNKSVSRRHAYITSINGVNYLRDNNSTNHTYLNGKQVYSSMDVPIPDNSIIKISNEEFLFKSK